MLEKYLPIGSVVILKTGKKRIMITGFMVKSDKNIFDYSGCLFPEGIIDSNQNLLFNHDQIEHIYFIGLNDEEEREFKAKLKSIDNEARWKSCFFNYLKTHIIFKIYMCFIYNYLF